VTTYVGKSSALGHSANQANLAFQLGRLKSSKLKLDVCDNNQRWRRLVNAYEVEAGMVLFAAFEESRD